MNELIGPIAKLEGQSRTLKQTEGEAVDLTHQLIVIEREYERVEAERDAALEWGADLDVDLGLSVYGEEEVRKAAQSFRSECERLRSAINAAVALLGPNGIDCSENDCEGCKYEMNEALAVCKEALGEDCLPSPAYRDEGA